MGIQNAGSGDVKVRRAIRKVLGGTCRAIWRRRGAAAPTQLSELEFLKLTGNHNEYCSKLGRLGLDDAAKKIRRDAFAIASRWYRLALEHLDDAEHALRGPRQRAAYSRAYYAAYNASKALRYLNFGSVSLAGDDHRRAVDLPDDFPRGAEFSQFITTLFEHRLAADYDNWRETAAQFSLDVHQSVERTRLFVTSVREFALDKFGCNL